MQHLALLLMVGIALGIMISEGIRTNTPKGSMWLLLPPGLVLCQLAVSTYSDSPRVVAETTTLYTLLNGICWIGLLQFNIPRHRSPKCFVWMIASYLLGLCAIASSDFIGLSLPLSIAQIAITAYLAQWAYWGTEPRKSIILRNAAILISSSFWLTMHHRNQSLGLLPEFGSALGSLLLIGAQIVLIHLLEGGLDANRKLPINERPSARSHISFKNWLEISRILRTYQHDLRQPLSTINIVAGVGKAVSEKEATRQRFEHIAAAQTSFSAMLNDFFEGLHTELIKGLLPESAQNQHISTFSLDQIFHSLGKEYKYFAEAKGLSLRIHTSGIDLTTDRVAVEKILRNGLDNAIKFTNAGGIVIRVRRKWNTVNLGKVTIEILDTGIGVGNQETTESMKGWGFGSSIVHTLSQRIDGLVEIKRRGKLSRGTSFSLTLPLLLEKSAEQCCKNSLFILIQNVASEEPEWTNAEPAWFRSHSIDLKSVDCLIRQQFENPPRLGYVICASELRDIRKAEGLALEFEKATKEPLCLTVVLAPGLDQEFNADEYPHLMFAETRQCGEYLAVSYFEALQNDAVTTAMQDDPASSATNTERFLQASYNDCKTGVS